MFSYSLHGNSPFCFGPFGYLNFEDYLLRNHVNDRNSPYNSELILIDRIMFIS